MTRVVIALGYIYTKNELLNLERVEFESSYIFAPKKGFHWKISQIVTKTPIGNYVQYFFIH